MLGTGSRRAVAGRAVAGPDGLGLARGDRLDPDLARLDLLGLGEAELEDAVLERRLGLVGLEARRQRHGPHQAAARDLPHDPAALLLLVLRAVLGADRQGAVLDGDVDVLGLDPGQRRLHEQRVRGGSHVEREPAEVAVAAVRVRPVHGVVEQAVHRLAERHELAEGRRSTAERHLIYLLHATGGCPPDWCGCGVWVSRTAREPRLRQARTLTMVLSRNRSVLLGRSLSGSAVEAGAGPPPGAAPPRPPPAPPRGPPAP